MEEKCLNLIENHRQMLNDVLTKTKIIYPEYKNDDTKSKNINIILKYTQFILANRFTFTFYRIPEKNLNLYKNTIFIFYDNKVEYETMPKEKTTQKQFYINKLFIKDDEKDIKKLEPNITKIEIIIGKPKVKKPTSKSTINNDNFDNFIHIDDENNNIILNLPKYKNPFDEIDNYYSDKKISFPKSKIFNIIKGPREITVMNINDKTKIFNASDSIINLIDEYYNHDFSNTNHKESNVASEYKPKLEILNNIRSVIVQNIFNLEILNQILIFFGKKGEMLLKEDSLKNYETKISTNKLLVFNDKNSNIAKEIEKIFNTRPNIQIITNTSDEFTKYFEDR